MAAGISLLLLSIAALWRASRDRELRPIAFGIGWFWLALMPTSTIFPLGELTNDHRVFFPFMGLAAAVVWWVTVLLRRAKLTGAAGMRLPRIVVGRGRLAVAKDLFTRSYAMNPNYSYLHINLAIVSDAMGDTAAAVKWLERALNTDPGNPGTHQYFAGWLVPHARAPDAISQLRETIELTPASLDPKHLLLDLYAARGDTAKLKALARETLAVSGSDSTSLTCLAAADARPAGTAAELVPTRTHLHGGGQSRSRSICILLLHFRDARSDECRRVQ